MSLGLAVVLTGCSDSDTDGTADDPAGSDATSSAPSPTESPESPASHGEPSGEPVSIPVTGSAGAVDGWLVSATEAGGRAETLASPLDSEQAVTDFTGQFRGAEMPERVLAAVDAAQAGAPEEMVWGAVAAIGCDAPESVEIQAGEAGFEVTPVLPAEKRQCLAPVTYVVTFVLTS